MKLFYIVTFSLALHVALFFGLKALDSPLPELSPSPVPVEVVIINDNPNLRHIRNPKTPPPDSNNPTDPVDFLSEKNQRFKEQTRAKYIGRTENHSAPITTSKKATKQKKLLADLEKLNKLSQTLLKKLDDQLNNQQNKDSSQASNNSSNESLFDPSLSPSTINDPITNIPIGSFTALNTNRHLYYSFYTRIEDKFRGRWEGRLFSAFNRLNKNKHKNKRTWVTELELILDNEGTFVRADIYKSSGISAIDYAALDSFKDGAPYANPPQGLVIKNGLIYLRYSLTVYNPFYK